MIKKEILNDNTNITANSKQLEILKLHFPSCFDKNGAFIPHKMAEIVGENGLDLSRESYSLNWLGKSYARLLANLNPQTLLKEDKEHNAKEEHKNSQNLLIKGDNLEVLKHLKNAYGKDGGQVKMIYIDPPYNTGSDGFVYNDDRKFTPEQLSRLAGIELDEAKRILEFTASKSNSHSAWLTFMYPRLYVARELLREDGVIFISIDDSEAAQLKLLCDEVFGEENFIEQLIWKNKYNAGALTKGFSSIHEYILCYSKNNITNLTIALGENEIAQYKNRDAKYDVRGGYVTQPLATGSKDDRPNLRYPITIDGQEIWPEKQWIWSKERVEIALQNDEIVVNESNGKINLRAKQYLKDENGNVREMKPLSMLIGPFNQEGTKEITDLLGKNIFTFPKPANLIKHLLSITINDIKEKDGLYLDLFAGSGTTAHAVMALNVEDGGNRRFITVQIDEPTDSKSEAFKAGYQSVFEITKARIEKAAANIRLENPEYEGDLGFRIFETLPLFQGSNEEIGELEDGLELYDGSKLNSQELGYLLTTWKTYDGIELTEDLQPIEFAGYQGYTYGKNIYFMDKGFSNEALEAFIKALDEEPTFQPSKLVLYGYNFQSKFQRQIVEGLNSYKNKKSIELDVVMRY